MFKFLKFVLWVCLSVVMAYFLSDIKIGGKTLKENIDSILHSPKGQEIKKEIESYTEKKIKSTVKEVLDKENSEDKKSEGEKESPSDITKEEKNEVDKIIKKNK